MIRVATIIGGAVLIALAWFMFRGSETPMADPTSDIQPPSGQAIRFSDVVHSAPGSEGLTVRFRFVAPGIARSGGGISAETAQQDMLWLCDTYAVPRLPKPGPTPSQIVISLSDREVPFGEAAPDTTQFFEAYSLQDGQCVWEPF